MGTNFVGMHAVCQCQAQAKPVASRREKRRLVRLLSTKAGGPQPCRRPHIVQALFRLVRSASAAVTTGMPTTEDVNSDPVTGAVAMGHFGVAWRLGSGSRTHCHPFRALVRLVLGGGQVLRKGERPAAHVPAEQRRVWSSRSRIRLLEWRARSALVWSWSGLRHSS